MGLEAVKAAFNQSYRLGEKHAARSLLIWMAFNVRDEPSEGQPALTFWGSYQTAANGLGFRQQDFDEDPTRTSAALTAVKRTMRVLEAAGLIEKVQGPAPGRTKVWRLTLSPLDPVFEAPKRSNRGGRRPTSTEVEDRPQTVEERPVQGSKTDRLGGRSSTPLSVGPKQPDESASIERERELVRVV